MTSKGRGQKFKGLKLIGRQISGAIPPSLHSKNRYLMPSTFDTFDKLNLSKSEKIS